MSILQVIDLSRDTIQPIRECVNVFDSILCMTGWAGTIATAQDSQLIGIADICSATRFSGRVPDTVKNIDSHSSGLYMTPAERQAVD
jgi:hypothetical protein